MRWVQILAASVLVAMAAVLLTLVLLTPLHNDNLYGWTITTVLGLAYLVTGLFLFWRNADAVPAGGILSMMGAALAVLGILTPELPLILLLLVMNAVVAVSCFLVFSPGLLPLLHKR